MKNDGWLIISVALVISGLLYELCEQSYTNNLLQTRVEGQSHEILLLRARTRTLENERWDQRADLRSCRFNVSLLETRNAQLHGHLVTCRSTTLRSPLLDSTLEE